MFYAEANELRCAGNGAIACCRVAHGEDAHLGGHAIQVGETLRDGLIGHGASERSRNRYLCRGLIGKGSARWIEQDLVDGWQLPKQPQESHELGSRRTPYCSFEQLCFCLYCPYAGLTGYALQDIR